MKRINIKLEGIGNGLLMHRFPIADEEVQGKIKNRKQTKDDVESYLYKDEEGNLVQPSIHIVSAMKRAGSKFQVAGQGKTTFKNIIGSGAVCIEPEMIPHEIQEWEPDRRSVVVKQSRIVRTRPLLKKWALSFIVDFDDEEISKPVLKEILDYAGRRVGIGDFRPEKGGSFGRFIVTKFEEVK